METGHNSRDQLKSIVERIENLNDEIKGLTADRSDIFSEAKGAGFDLPALREIIKARKQDAEARSNREALIETYKQALGMLADTPLGQAALNK